MDRLSVGAAFRFIGQFLVIAFACLVAKFTGKILFSALIGVGWMVLIEQLTIVVMEYRRLR